MFNNLIFTIMKKNFNFVNRDNSNSFQRAHVVNHNNTTAQIMGGDLITLTQTSEGGGFEIIVPKDGDSIKVSFTMPSTTMSFTGNADTVGRIQRETNDADIKYQQDLWLLTKESAIDTIQGIKHLINEDAPEFMEGLFNLAKSFRDYENEMNQDSEPEPEPIGDEFSEVQ